MRFKIATRKNHF